MCGGAINCAINLVAWHCFGAVNISIAEQCDACIVDRYDAVDNKIAARVGKYDIHKELTDSDNLNATGSRFSSRVST